MDCRTSTPANSRQLDRDGTVLKELPPAWGGLTAKGVTPPVTEAQTAHLPNQPFAIDDPKGFNTPLSVTTRDLWHLFYQNQMQIDGGKNDRFAAWADSGGLVMGHYDGSKLPLWRLARKYVLADNFFQGAFGGSFLNHFQLTCACTPVYPNADTSPAKGIIAVVESRRRVADSGAELAEIRARRPAEIRQQTARSRRTSTRSTRCSRRISRAQQAGAGGDPRLRRSESPNTAAAAARYHHRRSVEPDKGISWAWYAGAWQDALDGDRRPRRPLSSSTISRSTILPTIAPGTAARAEHLKDGGMNGVEFIKAIDAGALPQVTFYKPQGNLNEHPGYTDAMSGDQHIADVVAHLEKSPQWPHMLVLITYDENGGFWDHVAPPKADRWGPGSRIPAFIVSPFAKTGVVDHTQYDTTSFLRFVTRRFDLPVLPGSIARDAALKANGQPPMGDLTNALTF